MQIHVKSSKTVPAKKKISVKFPSQYTKKCLTECPEKKFQIHKNFHLMLLCDCWAYEYKQLVALFLQSGAIKPQQQQQKKRQQLDKVADE